MKALTNHQETLQTIRECAEKCQQELESFQKKNEKVLKAKRMNSAISRIINTNRKIASEPLDDYEEVDGLYKEMCQGEDNFDKIVTMCGDNGSSQSNSKNKLLQSVSNVRQGMHKLVGDLTPDRKLF